jgi:hypothetical protein
MNLVLGPLWAILKFLQLKLKYTTFEGVFYAFTGNFF